MHRHIGRGELIDRCLPKLRSAHGVDEDQPAPLLDNFGREVLRRVDDKYLYRHRLTTLGAQLEDSFRWVSAHAADERVNIRVFHPTVQQHGYAHEGWVMETLMPDQPFIVDTLKLGLEQEGARVINSLNVIIPAIFDGEGQLRAIDPESDRARHISYTRWYVDWDPDLDAEALERNVGTRLQLAQNMVRDFHRMVRTVKDVANEFDYLAHVDEAVQANCLEVRDFLQWLVHDNFVFMALSFYRRDDNGTLRVQPERGLGTVAGDETPSGRRTEETLEFLGDAEDLRPPLLRIRKSDEEVQVHRPGKVDEILIRLYDDRGNPSGGAVIHGLFTFKGLSEPGSTIPILRRKLERVVKEEHAVRGSYHWKGLINAFNTLPVEYLFEAGHDEINELLHMIVTADATREIHSQVVLNDDARSAFAFIVLPKEHYADDIRVRMQEALRRRLAASYVDHRVHLGKFGTVALHFYLTGGEEFGQADLDRIESMLVDIGTPWTYRLHQLLEEDNGGTQAAELYSRWADAFPEPYTEITSVHQAARDMHHLQRVAETGRIRFDIVARDDHPDQALVRIYSREPMQLTSILPVVDNFGVVVLEQASFEVQPRHSAPMTVNTLYVLRGEEDVVDQHQALIGALRAVFGRRMRSDRLNRLLLAARLSWREVDLFRAYFHYTRQLGHQLDPEIVQKVLISHHPFVTTLVALFRTRFDPDLELGHEQRAMEEARLADEAVAYLDAVKGFEEDRILRVFLNLMQATVRTNFYRTREDGTHFLSLKFECARVREMPEPRPLYEIYVHHAQVEGVHLRGGRVARGGLRWSDRLDDYRSEVLGLMATQMLKNTLIVPVGAKGGFILKDPVDDPREARAQADRLYKIFIRGLLEVTDNRLGGEVVPPPRVLRYDGDDPYLVVAADKGTAHLSDAANEIAASFDFWLGDGFASGGSVGYDHKDKAITARGAWVCVRRHFLEMDVDPERDPITVVGIGDMSGDVFGNGMLLSRSMKLVAAFNHRHIFLDPDPDPETSWLERKRLFDTPGSQWTDYDRATLSEGGGIFDRGAKAIALPPQVREVLDTRREEMSGEELIRHILTAEVDLLWNGGIGTYVKSCKESHRDVEDKANDRVRVDAEDLRCKVVGEGGNLGVTMRGRVAFATRGGRINLDAIDNSGGVDLSDHEVNLKILLEEAVRHGDMDIDERNVLLADVGDEVCDRVLDNSASQSLAISLDEIRSQQDIWSIDQAMRFLRDRVGFSRRRQRLPRDPEALDARVAHGLGFLRPELGKLLSYSKMLAYSALMEHPVGTRDELRPVVEAYFPRPIVERCESCLDAHMLYEEIAATMQVNHIVDMAGVTFFPKVMSATDRGVRDVVGAYLLAEHLLDAEGLRRDLEGADVAMSARYHGYLALEEVLAEAARWLLTQSDDPVTLGSRSRLDPAMEMLRVLEDHWSEILPTNARDEIVSSVDAAVGAGLPEDIAERIALLPLRTHALYLAEVHDAGEHDVPSLASLYFAVGYGTRVIPLVAGIAAQTYRVDWDQIAITKLEDSLLRSMVRLTHLILGTGKELPSSEQLEQVLGSMPGLAELRAEIETILRKKIPVSAMMVLSHRIERRIDQMERAREAA
ncbi:MAG: NAD-glutamate dehydrogenase domain-containing protein [Myxococcota bacterium]